MADDESNDRSYSTYYSRLIWSFLDGEKLITISEWPLGMEQRSSRVSLDQFDHIKRLPLNYLGQWFSTFFRLRHLLTPQVFFDTNIFFVAHSCFLMPDSTFYWRWPRFGSFFKAWSDFYPVYTFEFFADNCKQ